MTDEEMLFVMAEFRKGYGTGDKERLLAVTTQDLNGINTMAVKDRLVESLKE